MAQGLNKCAFIGNLGKAPEIKVSKNDKEFAVFSIACNETWKDKDGNKHEEVEWVRIIAFGGIVNVIKNYVKKGSKVYVEGKFKTNKWTDEDGNEKQSVSIHVDPFSGRLLLLDSKGGGGHHSDAEEAGPIDDSSVPAF